MLWVLSFGIALAVCGLIHLELLIRKGEDYHNEV